MNLLYIQGKGYAFCPAPWNPGSRSLMENDMVKENLNYLDNTSFCFKAADDKTWKTQRRVISTFQLPLLPLLFIVEVRTQKYWTT